jgi:hypothetical protein
MQYGLFFLSRAIANPYHDGLPFRYCIPMDNNRPSLDLKYFDDICPDKNGMSKYDIIN